LAPPLGRITLKSPNWPRPEHPEWIAGYPSLACLFHVLLRNGGDRSLCAPLAHIEGSAYLGPGQSVTSQFSHSNSVNLDAGPSELLAFRPYVSQSGA